MKRTKWSSKRTKGFSLPVSRKILMVCCGRKTEPLYFDGALRRISEIFFKKSRGQTSIEYKIETEACDPLNMAKSVAAISKENKERYDEVWVVFDKDDFEKDNFDNAIHSILSMNKRNKPTRYIPLWSNQCIELWFLLHFEYLHSALHRNDYFPKLTKYIHKEYKKNDRELFNVLLDNGGKIELAMKNAIKLLQNSEELSYSEKWPATNVVKFFEEYIEYIE